MTHPTPWSLFSFGSAGTVIYDVDHKAVETVYPRKDDPTGELLAQRIVDAVNAQEAT